MAFPAISTGVYGYPKEAAARVAADTLRASDVVHVERVLLCAFSDGDAQHLQAALDAS